MTTRREFLALSAGALAVYAAGLKAVEAADRPLKILFLGGTGFLGPHQINHALARGHEVTMFNRGRNAGMYGDRVEELVGNRDDTVDDGLSVLRGDRRWDVVVDNSGYVPRHVRDSVELLKDRCGRYVYVSTVAVYDFERGNEVPESAPLAKLDDPAVEEVTVIGIPDDYRGEAPKAFVKLAKGKTATTDELLTFAGEYLSKIELPAEIEIRDELPKTIIGKLSKKELKQEETARQNG